MRNPHSLSALKGEFGFWFFSRDCNVMDDLIDLGSMTPSAAVFLRACVIDRKNILVSGGTGTGKTTMLNVLSSFIPHKERIVTIEDTTELQLHQDHVVTRSGELGNDGYTLHRERQIAAAVHAAIGGREAHDVDGARRWRAHWRRR